MFFTKGVLVMRNNKLCLKLLLVIFCLFGLRMNVYAATKLTCIYEKGKNWSGSIKKVILYQDEKGEITIYKNSKDADINGNVSNTKTKSYWEISTDNYDLYKGKGNQNELSFDSNGFLSKCPKSKTTASNGKGSVTFFGGESGGNQKLLPNGNLTGTAAKKPAISSSSSQSIPELTCVYIKKNVDKVAFTQSSNGTITVYKNSKDVAIDDESNYWYKSTSSVKWDSSTGRDTRGYLEKCPSSKKTNQGFLADGELTFYGNSNGSEVLEKSYSKVMNVQVGQEGSTAESNNFDTNNKDKSCSEISLDDKWLFNHDGYTLSCLYEHSTTTPNKCHIIQVNIGESGVKAYTSDANFPLATHTFRYNSITESKTELINAGECPTTLMVNRNITEANVTDGVSGTIIDTNISFSGSGTSYPLVKDGVAGKNLITGVEASYQFSFDIKFNKVSILSCDDLFKGNESLLQLIKTLVTVIKILVPILLIVLGSLDFAQAVFAASEDQIKKAQSKFVKRLIIGAVIFMIPSVLKVILTLAHSIWPVVDASLCGII